MSFAEDELTAITTQPFIGIPLYYSVKTETPFRWDETGNAKDFNVISHHAKCYRVLFFNNIGKTSSAKMPIAVNDVQQGREWINSPMVSTLPSSIPMIVPYSKDRNSQSCKSLQAQNEARAWQNSPMFTSPSHKDERLLEDGKTIFVHIIL